MDLPLSRLKKKGRTLWNRFAEILDYCTSLNTILNSHWTNWSHVFQIQQCICRFDFTGQEGEKWISIGKNLKWSVWKCHLQDT